MPRGDSAAQLRREAMKARHFAKQAVSEIESDVMNGIASTLEREAAEIDLALAVAARAKQSVE